MDWKKALTNLASNAKDLADKAVTTFTNSKTLKKLGATARLASKSLLDTAKKGAADFSTMLDEVGKDITGLLPDVKDALAKGTKIGKNAARQIVNKLKDVDAFGAVSKWTGAMFSEMGQLAEAIEESDIGQLTKEAVQGGMSTIKKAGAKLGAFTKEQAKAWGVKCKEAYGLAKDMSKDTIAELGAMAGTIDLTDLAEEVIPALQSGAIKLKGGADFAASWTKGQLKALSKDAKKAGFNGKTLKNFFGALKKATATELADRTEKVKSLVCPDGACPGAIVDIEMPHGDTKTSDEIKTEIEAYLKTTKATAASIAGSIDIAATADGTDDSTNGRRLAESDTKVTTVRLE